MKSVLISIQPKWCELIASGKKTVEVRKSRPKIATPFKCYIYCTKGTDLLASVNGKVNKVNEIEIDLTTDSTIQELNGKVIGEFVCQTILNYECEFVDDDCYEEIACVSVDEDGDEMGFIEWSNDGDIPYEDTFFYKTSRVGYEEIKKYMGVGFGKFYGWHISNLVIYEQPKELSEFRYYNPSVKFENGFPMPTHEITRPPQSWCYVADHQTEKGGVE